MCVFAAAEAVVLRFRRPYRIGILPYKLIVYCTGRQHAEWRTDVAAVSVCVFVCLVGRGWTVRRRRRSTAPER